MQVRAYGYDSSLKQAARHRQDGHEAPGYQSRLGGLHPDHHELLYILEGKAVLSTNHRAYTVTGPALLLIPLNTSHQLSIESKSFYYAFWELQDGADVTFPNPQQCAAWNVLQEQPDTGMPVRKEIEDRMQALNSLMNTDWVRSQPELIRQVSYNDIQAILAMIRHAVRPLEPEQGKPGQPSFKRLASTAETIEMLARWMESSYWESFNLQKMTDFAHFNSSYLIRMFKEYKGVTPFQFLNNLRMNAAEKYLAGSDMSVQEIAIITGFQSIHYFSRSFKQKYGKSPVQWRNDRQASASDKTVRAKNGASALHTSAKKRKP